MGCPERGTLFVAFVTALVLSAVQITMSGLCLVIFNFLTLLYYDPTYLAEKDGATGPPQWVYFTYVSIPGCVLRHKISQRTYSWAIGLFLYQSFDAIDGYASMLLMLDMN